MSEAVITEKTGVRLRIAALVGGAGLMLASGWAASSFMLGMTRAIEKVSDSQAVTQQDVGEIKQAQAILQASVTDLRIQSDRDNVKRAELRTILAAIKAKNPSLEMPEFLWQ